MIFLPDAYGMIQLGLLFAIVLLLVKPIGTYMGRVYNDQFVLLEYILGPIEDLFYRIAKIDPTREMIWQEYARAIISVSFCGFLLLYCILRFQASLPLNPQHLGNLSNDLSFNIAVSFLTNTNWQSYSPETTLSYFSQMIGLTVQNFLSASMGMAVAIAFIRGLARKNINTIGNFWVDWVRGTLYILLPLSFLLAIALGSQGVIQNFKANTVIAAIDQTANPKNQTIPGGPVASQVAIKQLGTNGGGFYNANSAHPFENPTPLTNFLELIAILLIPSALCYTFGTMINDTRQGWAVLLTMTIIFTPLMLYNIQREQQINPQYLALNIDQIPSGKQPGGNMEGKEIRFGIINSALWTSASTATSNGSVNSMLDSYTPLGGLIPIVFLLLSEVIYGGVGSGLYGMLVFILIAVFIAGLMVGRTPEYLGKKIQSFEIKMASLSLLIPIMAILFPLSMTILSSKGQIGIFNPGAQGLSEILYAFASCSGNNGSAFAGLNSNTTFYNTLLGIVMLFSRFWIIIPILAIAGSLANKNVVPSSSGTMTTHTPLFILFLIGIILMVGLLTYIPVITLAPLTEYFQLMKQ